MLISEFVKEYNETENKDELLSTIVIKKYIPYSTKVDESKRIVKICSYKEINGKETFVMNSPMRYIFFIASIIEQYTDLEFDMIPDSDMRDISKDIDLLEEYGITKQIVNAIGEDIDTFTTILNLVIDDEIDMNRSVVPFLDTKFEATGLVLNAIMEILDNPKVKDKIVSFIDKRKE